MVEKVFLIKPEDYKKENPKYDIKTGHGLHDRISTYCTIQAASIPDVPNHLLIVAHHPLGAGIGGWDSYCENIKMVHGRKTLPRQVTKCARDYARKLADKLKTELIDLRRVKNLESLNV